MSKRIERVKKTKAQIEKERAKHQAWCKKYRAEEKVRATKRQAEEKVTRKALVKSYPLPEPVKESDLISISYNSKDQVKDRGILSGITWTGYSDSFDAWYSTEFGWCFPTLLIKNASRGSSYESRSYAVTAKGGKLVRIGQGPHILAKATVYLKKSNTERLKPVLDLLLRGSQEANVYRDNLSTRRATSRRRYYTW